jgi:hypothetical protein
MVRREMRLRVGLLVPMLALVTSCHARSPFDTAGAHVRISRLQSYEVAPGADVPKEIQAWLGEGASGLPADLVPAGLVATGTPLPHFAADAPRFLGFHQIESRETPDALARDLLGWAENAGGGEERAHCMYPEFGLDVTHARGDAARILVSLSCGKMKVTESGSPASEENLSSDARARFVVLARRAFRSDG